MRTRAATFSSWLGLQLPVPASSDYFLLYFLRYVSSATDVVPWRPQKFWWLRFCGLQWGRKIAICPSYLADDWVTITTYLTLDWGVFKKVEVAASSKSCKVLHGSATQQHQLPPHICCCLKIQIWTLFFGAELRPNTELSWAHDTRMAVSKSLLIKPALLHAQLLIQTQPSYSHQSATCFPDC